MYFFKNPIIQKLAQNPRWTINIDNKLPIDIQTLKKSGQIFGATSEQCLITLPDLLDIMKSEEIMPKQFTYFLDAERDGIVVLDIEPCCPETIKSDLLNLDFLYGDISASGKGYHLIFTCPRLDDITRTKKVMKHPNKYYEILLNHYVTFTQNIIFPNKIATEKTFQEIWNELAELQKIAIKSMLDINISTRPNLNSIMHTKLYEEIIRAFQNRFKKTPTDYNNDLSRYEFGVIGALRSYLQQITSFSIFNNLELDENDKIWMIYDVVSEVLPYRPKHDEKRDGQPFLFYLVCKSFTTSYENQ